MKVFGSPLIVKFTFPFISFVHGPNEVVKKLLQTFRKKKLPSERKSGSGPEELV